MSTFPVALRVPVQSCSPTCSAAEALALAYSFSLETICFSSQTFASFSHSLALAQPFALSFA